MVTIRKTTHGTLKNGSRTSDQNSRRSVTIPDVIRQGWQGLVENLAQVAEISALLLWRIDGEYSEVIAANADETTPYKLGQRERLLHSGRLCEEVFNTNQRLYVPDVAADARWRDNPMAKRGVASYLGNPVHWPDGSIFGTLCAYGNHANAFNGAIGELFKHLVGMIENDLELLRVNRQLSEEINERKLLEARYRMLLDHSEDYIWVIDAATRQHSYLSPAVQQIWGYTPEEIMAGDFTDKLSAKSRELVGTLFAELDYEIAHHLPNKPVDPIEIELIHKDGHIVCTETTVVSIENDSGPPTCFIGISRDISHRQQIEEERRLREEELRQAKETAEEANRAKTLFLANMSHEIRTPLSALVGLSQVMVSQGAQLKLPEGFVRMLSQINSGGRYLNMMLTNLLDLSAIEHGEPRLHLRLSSLAEWSRGMRDILEPIAGQREVVLRWRDEELATAEWRTDPARLSQILINLVHNAIKFTPAGKCVEVTFKWRDYCFALEVSDEGPGLPPEQQNAFNAFSTGVPSISDLDHGVGLGLYVVRINAQLLDGSVSTCNREGGGACFKVEWRINESEV